MADTLFIEVTTKTLELMEQRAHCLEQAAKHKEAIAAEQSKVYRSNKRRVSVGNEERSVSYSIERLNEVKRSNRINGLLNSLESYQGEVDYIDRQLDAMKAAEVVQAPAVVELEEDFDPFSLFDD